MPHSNPQHRHGKFYTRDGHTVHQQKIRPGEAIREERLLRLIGQPTVSDIQAELIVAKRAQVSAENTALQRAITARKEKRVTVSLYKSTTSGAMEVVVQTNAQSLDVFISGVADALEDALLREPSEHHQGIIAATLRNAFPVAFAISGYKADKVNESKLLTCGLVSPDVSELMAQSKV